ncbi:LOW QUALITY PROTEIN: uncharacterized protein [Drosophila kikkawai]|uniref:LOW QUALITY PROTEIN: uncharacterized protein n=1 Tax=Drosophila kikkawai TaxID=30033 RepID=A0A6P4IYL3_DROKI
MPCIFNPAYIGPTPPCCDHDCGEEEGQCTVPESQLPRCNPAREPKKNPEQQNQEQKQEEKQQK